MNTSPVANAAINPTTIPHDAAQLACDVSALVSPPMVCTKLFELVHSARASAEQIGDVISLDPNLAARLLRIVNSPFYGLAASIDSIPRAVAIIGTRELYNLALSVSAVRSFSKLGAGVVRMETFWHHSVFCALVTRELAKTLRIANADSVFVAGLLHDIGICVMYNQLPEFAARMRASQHDDEHALYRQEMDELGFSHACVGSLVLEQWKLPSGLREAVRHHHDPAAAGEGRTEAALVHLADVLANGSEAGVLLSSSTFTPSVDAAVWEVLDVKPESLDLDRVLANASQAFTATLGNLLPGNNR